MNICVEYVIILSSSTPGNCKDMNIPNTTIVTI